MSKAIFCDRDGVINIDHGYVGRVEDFELIDGVIEALASFRRQGFMLVLVTNQSGIARGMYTEEDFWQVTDYMQDLLAYDVALFDAVYFCPHHPQAQIPKYRLDCDCRKPRPGMILSAASDLNLDLKESFLVGDKASDLKAGLSAGVGHLILVGEHQAQEAKKLTGIAYTYYQNLKEFASKLTQGDLSED